MTGCVWDMEGSGLRDHMLRDPDAQIHCLMAQELELVNGELVKGKLREFYDVPLDDQGDQWEYMGGLDRVPDYLNGMSFICGHNLIDYDIPIVNQKLGQISNDIQVVDTLVMSRKNWPDRPGLHSVDAWAKRMGMHKPVQEDWSKMTQDVRNRCREDVLIETNILHMVLNEAWEAHRKCH